MDREITEGFDTTFGEIGFDFDTMSSLNKVAETVAVALEELHNIMFDKELYNNNENFEGSRDVFDEYRQKFADNMQDAGNSSVSSVGSKMVESSLEAITEVLQETLGKEYGIEFSHTDIYHDSKLMVGKYEYTGDGDIREAVEEALEKAEHGNER